MNFTSRNVLRLTGIIASLAFLIVAVADTILLYSPNIQPDLRLAIPSDIPHSRLMLGHYLGIFSLPITLLGVWHVYLALKSGGQLAAFMLSILEIFSWSMGVVYRGNIPFISTSLRIQNTLPISFATPFAQMLSEFQDYQLGLQLFFFGGLAIWSVIFVGLILLRNTLYPRWMAILNPIFLLIAAWQIFNLLPSDYAIYLYPSLLDILNFIFYAMSTFILWNSNDELPLKLNNSKTI